MTPRRWPRLLPLGDRGLLVEFPPEVSPETTARVLGADRALQALPGVVETVPAFRTLLLVYDPGVVTFEALTARVETVLRIATPLGLETGRVVDVPVRYGGSDGPDLDAVAASCGLPSGDVVRHHASQMYLVYMLGFSPGFPYLGLLPEAIRVPRRATPRPRVPAGSVAIAERFSGIYPQDTAGGWHLIGRTDLRPFDPARDPAFLLQPGDRVRFVPVAAGQEPRPQGHAASPGSGPAAVAAAGAGADAGATAPAIFGVGWMPPRPVLRVVEPGLLTTVQDLGRPGWRRFGVPASGALDRRALRAANAAVGNPPGAACLECAFPGPRLVALEAVTVAVAGADFDARHNGRPLEPGAPARLRAGDELAFGRPRHGQWAYVAVAGGLDVPPIFGSRATFARGALGGVQGRALRAGDILGRGDAVADGRPARRSVDVSRPPEAVRVVLGPQADAFPPQALAALLGGTFRVTARRDRSGMRLDGPRLAHRAAADILSDGVLPGAVQVPADGQPIVILADGPTTGGYTKIASVIDADLDALAQAPPGHRLRFVPVTVPAAHAAAHRDAV